MNQHIARSLRVRTNRLRNSLFAPFFAAYPVLFIALANPGQPTARSVLLAAATALAMAGLILFIMPGFSRSRRAAGVFLTLLVVLFYAYGPVHARLELWHIDALAKHAGSARVNEFILRHLDLLLTAYWLALAWLGYRALERLRSETLMGLVRGLNATAAILLVLLVAQLLLRREPTSAAAHASASTAVLVEPTDASAFRPDVYVIVMDGYARNDVLQKHYGFSNSEFVAELATRDFHVSSKSRANYNWTFLSLASTLNMQYVQDFLGEHISPGSTNRAAAHEAIRNSALHQFLRHHGYQTVHFQSTWGATLDNRYADIQVPCQRTLFTNEFYRVLVEASWLKIFQSRVSSDLAECHLSNLRNLPMFAGTAEPKLVFVHFLPPHHPYLFDRDGNILQRANISNQLDFQNALWEERDLYVEQLIFMNDRILAAIDEILAKSQRPPVIILKSDHGPNITRGLSEEEYLRVRYASFAAFLLPGEPNSPMPDVISAVNIFRYVLNEYFDAGLPILGDRFFFSDFHRPYRFIEIRPDGMLTAAPRGRN